MDNYEILTAFVVNVLFVTVLGWYLITNLQWYDYKLSRVILKHHKPQWHVLYFLFHSSLTIQLVNFLQYFFSLQFFHLCLFGIKD